MFAEFQLDQQAISSPEEKRIHAAALEDSKLWQRFKSGNDLAFSILYKKHVQNLYNYGMHTCNDHELVLDCLQELFGRLWEKRDQVADVKAVNFYLFKSFRRLLINKIVQKRKQSLQLLNDDVASFEILNSFEDVIILEETNNQKVEMLKKAISTLTKRQREAIFLKFFNELNYHDVASIMEMNVDSVYNLMNKAIDALRKVLKRTYICFPLFYSFFN